MAGGSFYIFCAGRRDGERYHDVMPLLYSPPDPVSPISIPPLPVTIVLRGSGGRAGAFHFSVGVAQTITAVFRSRGRQTKHRGGIRRPLGFSLLRRRHTQSNDELLIPRCRECFLRRG